MGRIFDEVQIQHLRYYPSEREWILPFQTEFDITWAARRTAYGSDFSTYIVRPDKSIREIFGLGIEVALFVFDYDTLEARTFQAINQALTESPLNGRVEPAAYFLLSKDPMAPKWTSDYLMRNPQPRNPIAISFNQLAGVIGNKYRLRDLIASFAFRRDLFDYRLPINSDIYFFGRETLISELADQIKKSQNTGVFGLRKTGKTSLLYKIARDASENKNATVIYLDCKSPVIRKKRTEDLLAYVNQQIALRLAIPSKQYEKVDSYEGFEIVARISSKKKPLCLIFDEIEYISPFSLTDPHWKDDFIDFWQLLWSTQSRVEGLSFIVSGVNAAVCETPSFAKIQNPLFGIVNTTYVQGLDSDSLTRMITYFGGQMGLQFTESAIARIEQHYGGHPLLTRMACSYIHRRLERETKGRPIKVTDIYVEKILEECDNEIASYCAHVVSELKDFYPDEYDVIKMAALGQRADFLDFAADQDLSRHLRAYGILKSNSDGLPEVALPVLKNFLRAEHVRAIGGRIPRELVVPDRRLTWTKDMVQRIIHDCRVMLQALLPEQRSPFGARGIPDSDKLVQVRDVSSKAEFENFATTMYNVFYENIARGYPGRGAFFGAFKADWPALFTAVDRIRVYRDYTLHLDVSEPTRQNYGKYLEADLGGSDPAKERDGWFALQQAILDELAYAIQVETAAKGK